MGTSLFIRQHDEGCLLTLLFATALPPPDILQLFAGLQLFVGLLLHVNRA